MCVCVCVVVRVVRGAVAFLRPGADDTAWPRHKAAAFCTRVLCVGHLGRAHCCHSAADGRALCFPPHSSPALVGRIMFITPHSVYGADVVTLSSL